MMVQPPMPPPRHPQPPGVPVVIEASTPINVRYRTLPILVEFGPGLRFQLQPGENQVFLAPGVYRADVYSQYVWMRVGRASLTIDTRYGPVWFSYAAPYTIYNAGAIGFARQERPGKSTFFWILGLAFASPFVIAGVVLAIGALVG